MQQYAIYDPQTHIVQLPINYHETQPANSTDIMPTEKFVLMCFDPDINMYYEGCSEDEMTAERYKRTMEKYDSHKRNGWEAYQLFRAKIVDRIELGTMTEEQAFMIEEVLSPAYDKLAKTGDWKTARYKLFQIEIFEPWMEEWYISATEIITEYISNNYES